jgi:RNA polymerase sigma-70 factor, ECF subfamily
VAARGPTVPRRAACVSVDPHELAAIYRREVGRCTATLVRLLGDIDQAEDAVADAFAVAADRWTVDGVPPNPGGWITATARNRAINRLRRESTRDARGAGSEAERSRAKSSGRPGRHRHRAGRPTPSHLPLLPSRPRCRCPGRVDPAAPGRADHGRDRPCLPGARTDHGATPEPGQAEDPRHPHGLPDPHGDALPERLGPVLATIYLMYTEGHSATAGDDLLRPALTGQAIRVGRTLVALHQRAPFVQVARSAMRLRRSATTCVVRSPGQRARR